MGKTEALKAQLKKLRGSDPDSIAQDLRAIEIEEQQLAHELGKAELQAEREAQVAEYREAEQATDQAETVLRDAVAKVSAAWQKVSTKLTRAEEIAQELSRAEYVASRLPEEHPALSSVVAPAPAGDRTLLTEGPNIGRTASQLSGLAELLELARRKRLRFTL